MTGFHITAVSWAQGVPPSSVDVKVPFATGQKKISVVFRGVGVVVG